MLGFKYYLSNCGCYDILSGHIKTPSFNQRLMKCNAELNKNSELILSNALYNVLYS